MTKKMIPIRIPMIVTADGRWAAGGSHTDPKPDWPWLDELCDDINPTVMPMRFWIETSVEIPEVETIGAIVKGDT